MAIPKRSRTGLGSRELASLDKIAIKTYTCLVTKSSGSERVSGPAHLIAPRHSRTCTCKFNPLETLWRWEPASQPITSEQIRNSENAFRGTLATYTGYSADHSPELLTMFTPEVTRGCIIATYRQLQELAPVALKPSLIAIDKLQLDVYRSRSHRWCAETKSSSTVVCDLKTNSNNVQRWTRAASTYTVLVEGEVPVQLFN